MLSNYEDAFEAALISKDISSKEIPNPYFILKLMKKNIFSNILLLTTLTGGVFLSPIQAEEKTGFYGTVSIGTDSLNAPTWGATARGTDYGGKANLENDGLSYDLGIGYDFGKWRTDLTYSEEQHDLKSCTETKTSATCATGGQGEGDASSIIATVYRDFSNDSKWTPYIGAGLGTTNINSNNITVNSVEYNLNDKDTFTYQVKAGTSYEITEKAVLFGEISYKAYNDITSVNTNVSSVDFDVTDISSFGFRLGTRFIF
ncbi:porin family protein [Prochlorococcus marinus XMU1412]|uniref:outer membrane protein n=1 Tax=Prochlorococcus marinus TaxID=1219 RepID=UPI001ADB1324|nr:outer membrane beta-barrel protein [Prochlorococcus marinus]MBO8240328.1 porin family protein [Prochlorococcus marinus XMU1412]